MLMFAFISGGGVRLDGAKKGKAAGVVRVVGRGAAVSIGKVDKHPYRKIAGRG